MHLAIYLPSLHGGGAERAMVTLANGFAARGLRVDLVLASAVGPYVPEVSSDVRIIDLLPPEGQARWASPPEHQKMIDEAIATAEKEPRSLHLGAR